MEFYASWDDTSTNVAWNRPSLHALIQIWNELNTKHDLSDYEVYLAGGFAEYLHNPTIPPTWDIDIYFVSDNPNYSHLKSVLDDAKLLSIKNNVLSDVKGITSDVWNYFKYIRGGKTPPEKYFLDKNMTFYTNFLKFTKIVNGEIEIDNDLGKKHPYTEVCDGLYQFKKKSKLGNIGEKKYLDKINSGVYSGVDVNLKTTNFNFVT